MEQSKQNTTHSHIEQEKVLFDLKECEHLYQKDKSQKQQQDIQEILKEINELKQIETEYYSGLLISDEAKDQIFGLKPDIQFKKKRTEKIIGQDPIFGNQVLTRQEFSEKYGKYPK